MDSRKFERQIERIHQLIDGKNASVTWDDHIPDPDNLEQPRQIDITIRYPDSFTIVECRIHSRPQDVNWIEELIGRRASLRADAVIAVSASGFSQGAKRKAKEFGIILRDFHTLSEDEIRGWGEVTEVGLTFYEFTDITFGFVSDFKRFGPEITISDEHGEEIVWRGVFESMMNELDSKGFPTGKYIKFKSVFDQHPMFVDGVKPLQASMEGRAREVNTTIRLASVVTYADPSEVVSTENGIHIEKYELGEFEIIKNASEVSAVIDLSNIEIPDNSFFYTVNFDFKRKVVLKTAQFIGLNEAVDWNNKFKFRFQTP